MMKYYNIPVTKQRKEINNLKFGKLVEYIGHKYNEQYKKTKPKTKESDWKKGISLIAMELSDYKISKREIKRMILSKASLFNLFQIKIPQQTYLIFTTACKLANLSQNNCKGGDEINNCYCSLVYLHDTIDIIVQVRNINKDENPFDIDMHTMLKKLINHKNCQL